MQFNLNTILATVPFLTTAALAGCYKQGEQWTDLGNVDQVFGALATNYCNVHNGTWKVGERVDMCILVDKTGQYSKDNSLHFSVSVTSIPDGQDTGYLSQYICLDLAEQITSQCAYGGIFDLVSGPGADGGDVIGASVIADPQRGPNCGK